MYKETLLLFAGLLLAGCGRPIKHTQVPRKPVINTSLSQTPLPLHKQTWDCSENLSWEHFDLNLHLFIGGSKKLESRNFEGLLQDNFLRSIDLSVIERSLYGEEQELVFSEKGVLARAHLPPKDIDVCPGNMDYWQNTVESAALNASYFIRRAHDEFTAASGKSLGPITLNIAPRISQTLMTGKVRQTFFLTDNAFYQPDLKTITFLPHSLEARMGGFTMSFWEIPMVPTHEYGHHIFSSIFGNYSASLHGTTVIKPCFAGDHHQQPMQNLGPRQVRIIDVLHAYNEGFADLISHYTLSAEEGDLTGVKCMESSRQVTSENFFDGTPKIFSRRILSKFFSKKTSPKMKSCEEVDFQDVHSIGAIFAHNADRILSSLTESREQKLQLLNEWLIQLKKEHPKLSPLTPERYFEEVFQIFLRLSLKKFDKKFDRSSCEEVNKIYPGLRDRLVECF